MSDTNNLKKISKTGCEKFYTLFKRHPWIDTKILVLMAIFLFLFVSPWEFFAAEKSGVLTRLTGSIKLDGKINESAWKTIKPVPLTMYQPTHRGTPSEQTEIRIAYDDKYLYAGGQFFDSDPKKIRSSSLYRDRLRNDDTFELIIDTFNDNENALLFIVTPAGNRIDAAISQDGRSLNGNWDTFWDAATTQNDKGWFAEIRIPFSSLGFRKKGESVTIGIITSRAISRKNEILVFPDISPKWSIYTPSQGKKFVMNGVKSEKPVYVTPYLLGGYEENANFDSSTNSFVMDDHFAKDAGLDIKYNMTHNMTLDLTINTDFSQVEADDQQVNLTRFSLFFPEKRRFFQERAGIFSFDTARWSYNRLFHSRRIGLHEGEIVPIIGGVRMVGRAGAWDIGLFNIQTAESEDLPSENFGVFRLRRQVFNKYSYVGGILTTRTDFQGDYNLVFGLDGIFRLFGDEYLVVKWAQTFDSDTSGTEADNLFDSASIYALWQRRSQKGLNYTFCANRSGKNYNPEIGFVQRFDFTELSWSIKYNWIMGKKSPFREINPIQLFGFVTLRNGDGSVESAQLEYDTDFIWKNGAGIWADMELYYEDLMETIPFPENTEIPAGSYTFYKFEGGYYMGMNRRFRAFFSGGIGTFYDGWRGELSLGWNWNPSPHLGLYAEYWANFIRFTDRDQSLDAHILRLRVETAANSKLSLSGFIQFNSVGDFLTSNLRLRYNIAEGRDLWLVYNEGRFLDRLIDGLQYPAINDRTIILKFTYTFSL